MTLLQNPVYRITQDRHSLARRPLIVGFERGDVLSFREFGRRKNSRIFLDLHQAYTIALNNHVRKVKIEKKKARKEKRLAAII